MFILILGSFSELTSNFQPHFPCSESIAASCLFRCVSVIGFEPEPRQNMTVELDSY